MGRQPCCEKVGLRRGTWTIEEDQKLVNFILKNGIQCWRVVPKLAGNVSDLCFPGSQSLKGPQEEGGRPNNVDDHDQVKDDSLVPGEVVCGAPDTRTNGNLEETHCSEPLPTKMDISISEADCCGDMMESADSIFWWDSLSEIEQIFH
ncbi:hypothetical protein SAY87_013102 [Trapa incisa]|uniref:Uncharacterized protein n=1 Tax=Trapa incisa TaxID=236973 RepID=A0AAN7KEL1_9MYRT|nr:hypothetical protein SAY87_013102 [Trapa incisa]